MSRERVEAFTDGVFAIAITLLVLTIAQPTNYQHLAAQLGDRWPALAAYLVSFAVIGVMWLNHHTIFSHLEQIDRGLFYCNLVLLMTIVFIPYPTGVFGEALRRSQGAETAAAVYSITMTVNGCAWAALWLYASTGRRLLRPDFPETARTGATLLFVSGAAVYGLSIGVAFINAYACLAFHAVLGAYYGLDPIGRHLQRRPQT
jgi:uncharacterized membrane protein